jgi:hypothetical protein
MHVVRTFAVPYYEFRQERIKKEWDNRSQMRLDTQYRAIYQVNAKSGR